MIPVNSPSATKTLPETPEIDKLNALAWEQAWTNPKRACELAERAYVLATSSGYKKGLAESLIARAKAGLVLAQHEAVRRDAERAKALFEALGDARSAAKAINFLGMALSDQGYLTEALEIFLANRRRCKGLADTLGEANALNRTALVFTYLGDYPSALEFYEQALGLYEALELSGELAATLQNIGLAHFELGDFSQALAYFERSLATADDRDKPDHAITLMNIGRAYEGLGDLEQALAYSLASLRHAEKHDNEVSGRDALDNLGSVCLKLGRFDEAQAHLERALTYKQKFGDRRSEAKTLLIMGQLARRRGLLEAALAAFSRACEIARAVGSKSEVYKAHLALAESYEEAGRVADALRHYRSFIAVRDEVFSEASDRKLQALRVSYEVEHKEWEKEIYRLKNIELVEANEELKRTKEALEQQAREDVLTGLYNRRYLDGCFEMEFERAQRYNTPLSVVICDIDNFKAINDTFSHSTGDAVLTQVAEILRAHVRKVDTVARYGGEEFVLLMPQLHQREAAKLCERLRALVEAYPWSTLHPKLRVTISMGLTSDLRVADHEKMLTEADLNLYRAKRTGKNRVCS